MPDAANGVAAVGGQDEHRPVAPPGPAREVRQPAIAHVADAHVPAPEQAEPVHAGPPAGGNADGAPLGAARPPESGRAEQAAVDAPGGRRAFGLAPAERAGVAASAPRSGPG